MIDEFQGKKKKIVVDEFKATNNKWNGLQDYIGEVALTVCCYFCIIMYVLRSRLSK